MANVREFTDAETGLVSQALKERYGEAIPLQFADAEIQLIAESPELTTCPIVYWEARGANFVIFKLGDDRYRAQFYYSDVEQFGTGKEIFNNLGDCVITLLQVQSDHERTRAGIKSGMNAYTIGNPDDYDGPLVV
ncbi:MAG: hypothetical protein OEL88_07740 [Sterolibacteriaceae bacterium MAG5]|nr:hypothetical protein [Candidatus Nitricoxidireducens bremensis]